MIEVRYTTITPETIVECDRCHRYERAGKAARELWNFEVENGAVVRFLCHDCQPDDEDIEAQVHGATVDYGRDAHGHLIMRPKLG